MILVEASLAGTWRILATTIAGPLVVGAIAGAVGLLVLKGAAGFARTALAIRSTEPSGAGDVGPGLAAVVGRVEPAGETLTSPLGSECVAYRVEQKHAESGQSADPKSRAVPFYVTDPTGRVLVDVTPRNRELNATDGRSLFQRLRSRTSDDEVTGIAWGEGTDATAADATDWRPDTNAVSDALREEVPIRETRIEPGEEVYVLASAVDEPLHGERPVLVNRSDNPFTVAERESGSADPKRDEYLANVLLAGLGGVAGVAILGATIAYLLSALG